MPFPILHEVPTPRLGLAYAGAQRIDTGYLPTIPAAGGLSMLCWFKAPTGSTAVLIGSGKVPAAFNRCQINLQAVDKVRIYAKDDAANVRTATSNKTVANNCWHHVGATVDAANDLVKIYVDGLLDNSASGAFGVTTLNTFDFTIGCLHNEAGYTAYLTGQIAEPAIYSRVITFPEVRLHMLGRPAFAGLEVYYPFKSIPLFGTGLLRNAAKPGTYSGTLTGTPRVVPCPGVVSPMV